MTSILLKLATGLALCVVGVEGIHVASYFVPPVHAVVQPMRAMAAPIVQITPDAVDRWFAVANTVILGLGTTLVSIYQRRMTAKAEANKTSMAAKVDELTQKLAEASAERAAHLAEIQALHSRIDRLLDRVISVEHAEKPPAQPTPANLT